MDKLDLIKKGIKRLYETNPEIHISVKLARSKIVVENTPVTLKGIYKNIFQIEENDSGRPIRHSFQYGDVLVGHVVIKELNYVPTVTTQNKK